MTGAERSGVPDRGAARLAAAGTAAHRPLPTTHCPLPTTYCLPPAAYRLLLWLIAFSAALLPVDVARADDDPIGARRRRIERMSPAEKEELRRQQERFCRLDPAEQRRLRQLHEQLQGDEEADQLRRVMCRYCEWVKTLSPYERQELRELEPAERVERIQKIRQAEAKRPNQKDLEGLFRWMMQYVARHEHRILEMLPEERRQQVRGMSPLRRHGMLMRLMWERWREERRKGPVLNDEDLEDLRSHLSEKSRKRLEAMPREKQLRILAEWIGPAIHHQFRHSKGLPFQPRQEQLDRFFQQLPESEQDRLLSLPGEEMVRELSARYRTHRPVGRERPHPPGRQHERRARPPHAPGPPHGDRRAPPFTPKDRP